MATPKYNDRNFRDIFGDITNPAGGVSESRVGKTHAFRHDVERQGRKPTDITTDIAHQFGIDYRELPIRLSQSASENPPALTAEETNERALNKIPAYKEHLLAEKKKDEIGEEILNKTKQLDIINSLGRLDSYYAHAEQVLPSYVVARLRARIEEYLEQEDRLKDAMRSLQQRYPSLNSVVVSDDAHAPLSDFINALERIDGRSRVTTYLDVFKQFKNELQTALASVVYPELTEAYNKAHIEEKELSESLSGTMNQSHGYRPDTMVEAAIHQLTARHGIEQHLVNRETVGVNNGSSASLLITAFNNLPNIEGDIITPEYHWDGYDAIVSMTGRSLKEVPRKTSIRDYLKDHYEEKSLLSFSSNKNKESTKNIRAILLTNPCSVTGREYDEETLRDVLRLAKEYHIPVIINEMHAGPSSDGKLFDSLTKLPEYKDSADYVLIIGSITKTCNITNNIPKFSYFYTANKRWAKDINNIFANKNRAFSGDDVALVSAYLENVTPEYWVNTERASTKKRDQVEEWMTDTNKAVGLEAVKWHLGRPDKGYLSSVEFSSEILKKAGITNSLELYEYLYKVSGVSVGEVVPSSLSENTGAHSIRINYGLEDNKLSAGLELMKHAVIQMQQGITLEAARETCARHHDAHRDPMEQMLQQLFGGSLGFRIVRGRGE